MRRFAYDFDLGSRWWKSYKLQAEYEYTGGERFWFVQVFCSFQAFHSLWQALHCCGLLITVLVAILKAAEHIGNSSGNAVTGIKYLQPPVTGLCFVKTLVVFPLGHFNLKTQKYFTGFFWFFFFFNYYIQLWFTSNIYCVQHIFTKTSMFIYSRPSTWCRCVTLARKCNCLLSKF